MKLRNFLLCGIVIALLSSCSVAEQDIADEQSGKPVVYQVFTRLFGNKNTNNIPWGTLEENGVGKFNDFNDAALEGIKELGVTHIWYTGILHHASLTDYTAFGIPNDDADVVKGRAGSPYAIRDYYNVDPDLAINPANRLAEFKALIERTHSQDMKVVIDLVPNHVARGYASNGKPDGVDDFGEDDDTSLTYARDNSFYYIPDEDFKAPDITMDMPDLGQDGQFAESPAKWTGNGSRLAQPNEHDWYETVKINFGVRPDGTNDFPTLPDNYADKSEAEHVEFWADKEVPASWVKFREIALYWLEMGVDGFRYDMAEMVPVEYWSYMNSAIKVAHPDAFLLAEIYQPAIYRDYIKLGKMGYIYDKVGLYDTLRAVVQGQQPTRNIAKLHASVLDIEKHMLHFLENHDEQRIASDGFAGSADKAKPAMVVSALIGTAPTMLYFAQDVGESGEHISGFGHRSRTSIFDYAGVPAHQRWMNGGKFDGGQLSLNEKELREFYKRLLTFSTRSKALAGDYAELHSVNINMSQGYNEKLFAFARWQGDDKLIVISNFDSENRYDVSLTVPDTLITDWKLADGVYQLGGQLSNEKATMTVSAGVGIIPVSIAPLQSFVLKVK